MEAKFKAGNPIVLELTRSESENLMEVCGNFTVGENTTTLSGEEHQTTDAIYTALYDLLG